MGIVPYYMFMARDTGAQSFFDVPLVRAQQARQAVDYLVGFTLSPVLWRQLPGCRSAGRVQSVALADCVGASAELLARAFKAHTLGFNSGTRPLSGMPLQLNLDKVGLMR